MFESMETSRLETELVTLAGRMAAAQCRFLLLLAEFDARGGWGGPEIRSCAHWLSWRVGLSLRAGREQLRVARALVTLPVTTEAFSAGRLSYAKVRAITRIATPDTERALVDVALAGTASHMERVVRAARRASTPAAALAAQRQAHWWWDEDGCLVLRAKLPPADGMRLLTALQAELGTQPAARPVAHLPTPRQPTTPATPGGPAEHRQPATPGTPGGSEAAAADRARTQAGCEHPPGAATDRLAARRADALVRLLAPDTGRHEVVVHLEVATETATLDDGLPVATSTAEQLACDSRVRALITRQGNPLYLGRSHRTVSTTQLAALHIRDRHRCQFPGCDHQRFLHAHHIVHWLHGGPTDLDNLTLLCGFHHRLLHTHRYGARRDGRVLRVWRPTGEQVTAQHPPPNIGETLSATDLLIEHDVRTDAIVPSWTGERLDLDAVLATLFPEPHPAAA